MLSTGGAPQIAANAPLIAAPVSAEPLAVAADAPQSKIVVAADEEEEEEEAPRHYVAKRHFSISDRVSQLRHRADALLSANKHAEAEAVLTDAVELSGPWVESSLRASLMCNRALARLALGRFEAAAADADATIALEPKWAKAHYCRGLSMAALERRQESSRAFREVLRLKPNIRIRLPESVAGTPVGKRSRKQPKTRGSSDGGECNRKENTPNAAAAAASRSQSHAQVSEGTTWFGSGQKQYVPAEDFLRPTLQPQEAIAGANAVSRSSGSGRSSGSSGSGGGGSSGCTSTSPGSRPLPRGWVARESRSKPGRFYYEHTRTGRATWKRPRDPPPPALGPLHARRPAVRYSKGVESRRPAHNISA